MQREAGLFREAGAEGIAVGCLKEDGSLHMGQMKELVAAAGSMKVTLHRAFDVCADPISAYGQAGELGIDTILTSGQESCCLAGMPLIKRLCRMQKETGGPQVMAGAGVTPEVIRQFLAQTQVAAYHLSAKKIVGSGMHYRKEDVPMGVLAMSEYSILRTDSRIVAEAKKALMEV